MELSADFPFEVPGQDQYDVGTAIADTLFGDNRDARTGQEPALLMW